MKTRILLGTTALIAGSLLAADSGPKDVVANAAKALGDKANYSWKTTVVVPEGSQYRPGPTEGQIEKGGLTHVTITMGDNTTQVFMKGEKAAVKTPDGDWQSLADLGTDQGPGRFMGMMVRNFKAPATQAAEAATGAKELKKDGDAYTGDLTDEAAKTMLSFRPRAGGAEGPTVSDAKGSAKFWLKDGVLAKYEIKVSGKMSFNGNDRDIDRTATTEIKDVGTTKVTVPDDAKKKME